MTVLRRSNLCQSSVSHHRKGFNKSSKV